LNTYVLYVNPRMARSMLAITVDRQRPLNEKHAAELAARWARGEIVPSTLLIEEHTGVVIDGQHRLRALELYGETQRFTVFEGPRDLLNSIRPRTESSRDRASKRLGRTISTYCASLLLEAERIGHPLASDIDAIDELSRHNRKIKGGGVGFATALLGEPDAVEFIDAIASGEGGAPAILGMWLSGNGPRQRGDDCKGNQRAAVRHITRWALERWRAGEPITLHGLTRLYKKELTK